MNFQQVSSELRARTSLRQQVHLVPHNARRERTSRQEAAAIAGIGSHSRRDRGTACPNLVSAAVAHQRIDTASRQTWATGERVDSLAEQEIHVLNHSEQR